ncbi:MAG TPA: YdeI/OmpD-associated family protein [Flavobacteriaceae bacterium]|nr:YdeI/OmpD-associated family protein [Flavobacteriaceae bacterium]
MAVKSVDEYIETHPHWRSELEQFREMILTTALDENIKWGAPVYSLDGKNVVGMAAFKNHVALWFYNGAFLTENTGLLSRSSESTKSLRQIKFQKGDAIRTEILREYITEAIQNQREGKERKPERNKKLEIPEELSKVFENNPELKKAFNELTLGKQREYCEYIVTAKRDATKQSRIEKIIPMVIKGKGLNDKYKKGN